MHPYDQQLVKEYITSSWYEYSGGDQAALQVVVVDDGAAGAGRSERVQRQRGGRSARTGLTPPSPFPFKQPVQQRGDQRAVRHRPAFAAELPAPQALGTDRGPAPSTVVLEHHERTGCPASRERGVEHDQRTAVGPAVGQAGGGRQGGPVHAGQHSSDGRRGRCVDVPIASPATSSRQVEHSRSPDSRTARGGALSREDQEPGAMDGPAYLRRRHRRERPPVAPCAGVTRPRIDEHAQRYPRHG